MGRKEETAKSENVAASASQHAQNQDGDFEESLEVVIRDIIPQGGPPADLGRSAVTLDPVLIYDADCAFCSSVVRFVLERDRRGTLRFARRGGPAAGHIIGDDNALSDIDSVVWVDRDDTGDPAGIRVRSGAALRLARYLGGAWHLLAALWIVPRPVRDAAYDLVARNRHRVMGRRRCAVPTADTSHRFLD